MKKTIAVLSIIMAMTAYAERVNFSTPKGNISIELEGLKIEAGNHKKEKEKQVEVKSSGNKVDEDLLIYNLIKKIQKLDGNYLSEIQDPKDRDSAKSLLKDMYVLLEALHPDKSLLFKIAEESEMRKEKVEPVAKKEITISDDSFDKIVERVKQEAFNNGKMSIVKMAMKDKKITLAQCEKLLGAFDFDDGKLLALEYAYPKVVDKDEGYTLIDKFSFLSSQNKVKEIIGNSK